MSDIERFLSYIRTSDGNKGIPLYVKNWLIFALATGLFLLISTASTDQSAIPLDSLSTLASAASSAVVKDEKDSKDIKADIENVVRSTYSDAPVLIEIAKCESHFTQFRKSGSVFRGQVVPADVGIMQINEVYHLDRAMKLGFNIYTTEGNLGYGRYLYEKYGVKPWGASKPCWSKVEKFAKAN